MKRSILLSGAAALALLLPAIASATLGESDASIPSDQTQMKAGLKVISRANFRVHEMQLSSGTVLREYVSLDGRVFAVDWSGPTIPDLRKILGRYFDNYVAAAQANGANHRQLQIQSADLIVHAGGRMRSFNGLAYLVKSMPAGVTAQDLR